MADPAPRRTIPEIRARMHAIADQMMEIAGGPQFGLGQLAEELHGLAEETARRHVKKTVRGSKVYRQLTSRIAWDIVRYAAKNPSQSYEQLSQRFMVNPGRISEVLSGKRDELVQAGKPRFFELWRY